MNRLKILLPFLFATSCILLNSCSNALKVSSFQATGAILENYKTYAWIAPGDTALNPRRKDKVYAGFIQSSADTELTKKGMKMDAHNPDAVFLFETRIEEKIVAHHAPEMNSSVGYGGYGFGYVGAGYYVGPSVPIYGGEISSIPVEEGTLTYSMFDRKTGKLLWKGSAIQKLDAKTDPERTIKKATSFIFNKLHIKYK
ncbi:MAG: DUF4136 domain-containing protein [Cyclobacteriaceae bacterium]|nr:DUF4136 domain-containing protein [Cyclobacteriaceae bacterium]